MSFRFDYEYNEEAIFLLQNYQFPMKDIVACRDAILSGQKESIGYWKLKAMHEVVFDNGRTGGMSAHDWGNVVGAFTKNKWIYDEYVLVSEGTFKQ